MNCKHVRIYLFFIFGIALSSCSNQPPECSIIAPMTGDEFSVGESVSIIVNAKDPDGKIDAVDIFAENDLLTSLTQIPFIYEWDTKGYEPGEYTISVSVIDDDGDIISLSVTIKLTEPEEEESPGTYFPLEEGYCWDYTGNLNAVTKTTGAANQDIYANVAGTRKVLRKQSLNLSTGAFDVFPVTDNYYSIDNSYEFDMTQTRYFEKTDGNTYMRAFEDDNGNLIEVSNPIYLKSKMVIGDEWKSDPVIDFSKMSDFEGMDLSDMDMETNSKIYVVSKENIEVSGNNYESVRLEQQIDATLTGTSSLYDTSFDLTYVIDWRIVMNLVKDIGMVKYEIKYNKLEMAISMLGEEIKVDFTGIERYELDNYKISSNTNTVNEEVLAFVNKSTTIADGNPFAALKEIKDKINKLVFRSSLLY